MASLRKTRKSLNRKPLQAKVESLESRQLMTAVSPFAGGPLTIHGSDANDSIRIREAGAWVAVDENNDTTWFARPSLITVFGNGGHDRITNNTSIPSHIYGGDGNDVIMGGDGNDIVFGGSGNDRIEAEWGNDTVFGENGDDVIMGSSGNDTIIGGNGNDSVYAGRGNDVVAGGNGNDHLDGGSDRDRLFGEAGNDSLHGYYGDDDLYGGEGSDSLYGGEGDDGLFGGGLTDFDDLYGGNGDDRFLVNGWRDRVRDNVTAEDATINFTNRPQGSVNVTGFGTLNFAAGQWTDAEIQNVDVALNNLHHHVGNTSLLETANGGQLTFSRAGAQQTPGSQILAWNGGNQLVFANGSFQSDIDLYQTIYHEVGHNWDSAAENGQFNRFQNLSGWGQNQDTYENWWNSFWGITEFVESGQSNDNWSHRRHASFAREYGKFNPQEDYATTWETYFAERYHGTTNGNQRVQAKFDNLDALFASLR